MLGSQYIYFFKSKHQDFRVYIYIYTLLHCMKCTSTCKHKLSPSLRKTELQNYTFVGEQVSQWNTVSHLNTHVLHHELLSITPSARLQSQASCFWWGEGERQRSRTLSQRHGSLRAGNDRLGKLVSVIILIMLIAAISTPVVMSQRQRHDWTALTRSVLK